MASDKPGLEHFPMESIGNYPLFHWSPSINRANIQARGLKIRSQALQGEWRPPYIAFAFSPQLAWMLSAGRADYEVEHKEWDLWTVWSTRVNHRELIPFDDEGVREMRVYRSVPAKWLWFVGSRSTDQEPQGQSSLYAQIMADLDDLEQGAFSGGTD